MNNQTCTKWWHTDCRYWEWIDEWTHNWKVGVIVASFVLGAVLAASLFFWAFVATETISCRNTAFDMGRDYRWSFSTDCLLRGDDGRFYPADSIIQNMERP